MPSAITVSHRPSAIAAKDELKSTNHDHAKYSWVSSPDKLSFSRALTNFERMFYIFNEELHGQNCPFIGASLSFSQPTSNLTAVELQRRSLVAWTRTRHTYPSIAARVIDGQTAIYDIESEAQVGKWAERTVCTVVEQGGWMALRERLSRETKIPSEGGDYCLLYLVVHPEDAAGENAGGMRGFDILMHTHHVFTDGSGIRAILNEFLSNLGEPVGGKVIVWGEEVERLLPASLVLEREEGCDEQALEKGQEVGKVRLKGFTNSDIGLPLHRPDLSPSPSPSLRGTKLVSYTFPPTFLPALLSTGRNHNVKLTPVLHAALLKAIYDTSDPKPTPDALYKSGSAMDLRNGFLQPQYCSGRTYINSAIAIQPIDVPIHLFANSSAEEAGAQERFWDAATHIRDEWAGILRKTGIARDTERDAKAFVENWAAMKNKSPPTAKPRTCPYFVSDPPGSQLLSPAYTMSGLEELELVLDSYQLATDQSQAVVSARSHSWNDRLTLCLVFNAVRNPEEEMRGFLGRWVSVVEGVCAGRFV